MEIGCWAPFFLYVDIFIAVQFYHPNQGLRPQDREAAIAAFSCSISRRHRVQVVRYLLRHTLMPTILLAGIRFLFVSQGAFSTINSTVLSFRAFCKSYLYLTQSRASPYFLIHLSVPGLPTISILGGMSHRSGGFLGKKPYF